MVTGEPPYDWISVRAAAKQLGIYYRTLYRRIDHGEVPAYKIGRLIRLRVHELEGEPSPPPLVRVEPTGRRPRTADAAAYLGLSHCAFRRIVRSGRHPFKVGGGRLDVHRPRPPRVARGTGACSAGGPPPPLPLTTPRSPRTLRGWHVAPLVVRRKNIVDSLARIPARWAGRGCRAASDGRSTPGHPGASWTTPASAPIIAPTLRRERRHRVSGR